MFNLQDFRSLLVGTVKVEKKKVFNKHHNFKTVIFFYLSSSSYFYLIHIRVRFSGY